jgi:hypothetical protein
MAISKFQLIDSFFVLYWNGVFFERAASSI